MQHSFLLALTGKSLASKAAFKSDRPNMHGEHVLVWAQVAGHPAWPARAPITWRTATSQVPVTFLGREGQTGRVSVAKLRPLMCADELAKANDLGHFFLP